LLRNVRFKECELLRLPLTVVEDERSEHLVERKFDCLSAASAIERAFRRQAHLQSADIEMHAAQLQRMAWSSRDQSLKQQATQTFHTTNAPQSA
jgi:hypothetical protein